MINAFSRFLVLVCAGALCCQRASGRRYLRWKSRDDGNRRDTRRAKNWIELGIGGTIVNGDNAQFEQEHDCLAMMFMAASRTCTLSRLLTRMACFRSMATRSGISTITTLRCNCRSQSSVTSRPVSPNFGVGTMATADSFRITVHYFQPPFPEMHIDRGRRVG